MTRKPYAQYAQITRNKCRKHTQHVHRKVLEIFKNDTQTHTHTTHTTNAEKHTHQLHKTSIGNYKKMVQKPYAKHTPHAGKPHRQFIENNAQNTNMTYTTHNQPTK